MKISNLPLILLSLFVLGLSSASMAETKKSMSNFLQADLKISAIVPSGGLTQGNGNKIRVTIANSGPKAVTGVITVVMTIKQGKKVQVTQRTLNGINANNSYGQPVWFNNLKMNNSGSVTIDVKVNPTKKLQESNYANNRLVKQFNVKGSGDDWQANGHTVTIQVFHKGTWGYQGPNTFKEIQSAGVLLTKNNSPLASGWTDANGRHSITIGPGTYSIKVTRQGFHTKEKLFSMGTSTKELNFEMSPGG